MNKGEEPVEVKFCAAFLGFGVDFGKHQVITHHLKLSEDCSKEIEQVTIKHYGSLANAYKEKERTGWCKVCGGSLYD